MKEELELTDEQRAEFELELEARCPESCPDKKSRKISRVAAAPKERNQYRGVHYHEKRMRWACMLKIGGTPFFVGDFHSQTEAAEAFDCVRWWTQEFSRNYPKLNFDCRWGAPTERVMVIRARLLELRQAGVPGLGPFKHKHEEGVCYRPPKDDPSFAQREIRRMDE